MICQMIIRFLHLPDPPDPVALLAPPVQPALPAPQARLGLAPPVPLAPLVLLVRLGQMATPDRSAPLVLRAPQALPAPMVGLEALDRPALLAPPALLALSVGLDLWVLLAPPAPSAMLAPPALPALPALMDLTALTAFTALLGLLAQPALHLPGLNLPLRRPCILAISGNIRTSVPPQIMRISMSRKLTLVKTDLKSNVCSFVVMMQHAPVLNGLQEEQQDTVLIAIMP